MDKLQEKFLQVVVAEYEELPEAEKLSGVENTIVARRMADDFQIEPSLVDSPDYRSSDAFSAIWRLGLELEKEGLIEHDGRAGGTAWLKPTTLGKDTVRQWDEENRSPAYQGRLVVGYIYDLQHQLSSTYRRIGKAGQVDLEQLRSELDIDNDTYLRGARWAERQGYLAEPSLQITLEEGGIYITDEGMNAYEKSFIEGSIQSGQTIDIHDITVAGDLLVAGQNAIKITSPELSASADEIRQLLQEIQEAIDTLAKEDDDYHDGRQELESLQREFSKKSPTPGRIERSLSAIGGLASIGTLAGPQLARLLELAQQLPG